jgi:hypothetical protein
MLTDQNEALLVPPDLGGYQIRTKGPKGEVVAVLVTTEAVSDIPPTSPDCSPERFEEFRGAFVEIAGEKYARGELDSLDPLRVRVSSADVQ